MSGLLRYALNGFELDDAAKKRGMVVGGLVGTIGGAVLGSIAKDMIPIGDPRLLVFGGALVGGVYGVFWLSNVFAAGSMFSEIF